MKKSNLQFNRSWLLTLLDLMLLMLTFFIMLYAMSTPKTKNNRLEQKIITTPLTTLQRGVHLNYLEQILSQQTNYHIKKGKNSLSVEIPQSVFAQGRNKQLLSTEEIKLKNLGEILSNISNEMLLLVSSENSTVQESLLQGAVIANKLKEGGYRKNLRISFQKKSNKGFVQLLIFEEIGAK